MRFNLRFLFFITVLAAILRLVFLGSMPPSPNWDEISHGYNAYSLLKTGTDEWGKIPIANFRAYGDYPLPLNLYITIPSIVIFGLTTFAIRFPHALLGIGSVLLTYFLAYGITKKRDISLLASLLLAISPWAVFTSRFVLQANVAVFFLIAGVTAFLYREKSRLLLPVSVVCLGLTLFSYHSTRIFTPLFVFAIIFVYKNEIVKLIKLKVNKLLTIGLFYYFLLPFLLFFSIQKQGQGQG
jgi:4-amino-4-deoxy-L-arabinose transferase-like glycosyltransferase